MRAKRMTPNWKSAASLPLSGRAEGGRYKGESNPRGRGEPRPYKGADLLKTAGWTGYRRGHFWFCCPPLSFRLNLCKQAKDSTLRLLSWV